MFNMSTEDCRRFLDVLVPAQRRALHHMVFRVHYYSSLNITTVRKMLGLRDLIIVLPDFGFHLWVTPFTRSLLAGNISAVKSAPLQKVKVLLDRDSEDLPKGFTTSATMKDDVAQWAAEFEKRLLQA